MSEHQPSPGRVILTREQWLLVKHLFRDRPGDTPVVRPRAEAA